MQRTMLSAIALMMAVAAPAPAATLGRGESFPAWSLKDHTGATVSSADLAGKSYLLWYYPAAMTPGCTAEGRGLRAAYAAYRRAGIEILGVSFDPPERNAEFVAAESFPFRLLSDEARTLAVAVGAADTPEQTHARRISYLVGPDGKVVEAYESVDPAHHAVQVLGDYAAARRKP